MEKIDFKFVSAKNLEELFALLKTSKQGLSKDDLQKIRVEYGLNELTSRETKWWHILARQFFSVFIYLLLIASLISIFLGEYVDAGLIFIFLLVNASLGFIQEYKAENSLKLLRKIVKRKTRVRREGKEIEIDVREVVPGDIVCLYAGDTVPADGRFIYAENVLVDESSLTGESVSVEKQAETLEKPADDFYGAVNVGFSGTTLMSGEGEVLIFASGNNTAVGGIAVKMGETKHVSAFEIGISKFSSLILKLIFFFLPLVFFANVFSGKGNFSLGEFIVFCIALTVSAIPEALPLVTTLSLSRGAALLARKHVVPKRLSAVEDLGSIEILCSDKTGTITENKHAVADYFGARKEALYWSLAASSYFDGEKSLAINVFDEALKKFASDDIFEELKRMKRINELPFDPTRRRESVLVQKDDERILIVRGAPEALLCPEKHKVEFDWVIDQGKKGRRVLAVAKKIFSGLREDILPADEEGAGFIGFVSFSDPLKSTTKKALRDAEKLGVRVKIITGDSKEVAGWVAYEAGIIMDPEKIITGKEFDNLSDDEKMEAVERYDVFARTLPLQKCEIIKTLQRKYLVGFLGEGFNDAPALKLAHVALAVEGASDIAKDASDLVLLDSSLEVIVEGIREGRRIFANTMKYIKATLASNFGNFFALSFSSLFIDYLPMLSSQILLLNLLSDFPMVSLATDAVDERELKRPRGYNVKEIAYAAIVFGVISTVFDFSFFGYFVGHGEKTLQTMWFIGSILTELVFLFSIRTAFFFLKAKRPGNTIIVLTGVVSFLTVIIPFTSFGQSFFGFKKPEWLDLLAVFVLVVLYFSVTEIAKLAYRNFLIGKKTI